MMVLVGCEESQIVCSAFRNRGHEAYSCDLELTRGEPLWHIHCDIVLAIPMKQWDLIILHPDCSAMAVCGNRWYGENMPKNSERKKAIKWTLELWELAKKYSPKVALENPVSVIFKYLPNVHYIQPHDFGHGETKKTGFALHNLEPLQPTNKVSGREHRIWKMPPSPTRKRDRSTTFPGVADAMATQWGNQ
jgi:hypothetical protein